MKLLNVIFLFGLCFSIALSAPSLSSSDSLDTSLHQAVSGSGAKKCRINICFAIDGSGSINASEFRSAKNFVQDVASIFGLSEDAQLTFGAVQFAMDSKLISPQIQDSSAFIIAVDSVQSIKGARSSIGAGIAGCDFQLATTEGEASRIILFSDGRNNFGANPVEVANNYRARDPNGKVDAVALGFPNINVLNDITAGGKVVDIDGVFEFVDSLDSMINDVCK